ncbi:MAG: hypothetical protein U9Q38_09800 [Thermodesulfobacteriota bacterium]|nr:hypothetical protein [Thermodesulfobacteriota bacterium]
MVVVVERYLEYHMSNKLKKKIKKSKKAKKAQMLKALSQKFQVNQYGMIKAGTIDPDYNFDIGGWSGKISDIDNYGIITIHFDYNTLERLPEAYYDKRENDNLDAEIISLDADEFEAIPGSG